MGCIFTQLLAKPRTATMIGDTPLEYSPGTLGLPQSTYDIGKKMILASVNGKNQLRDMHARWKPHILEDLRTASQGYARLPGLGTEFWRTAKLHILMAYSPPSIEPALLEPATVVDPVLLAKFVDHLKTQWAVPHTSKYHIQWNKMRFFSGPEGRLFLHIPLQFENPSCFQNGDTIQAVGKSYHGTRSFQVASILQKGLLSSTKAHKVIGLWLNDDLFDALNWNVSLMDSSGGLAFSVTYNPEFNRQNREIMSGSCNRRISELRNNASPSVQAKAIIVSVPSPQRLTWVLQLYKVFELMFQYVIRLPLAHHSITLELLEQQKHITWHFTATRLAYRAASGSMEDDFGGHYSIIPVFAQHVSKPIVSLLWALQLTSFKNRCECLRDIRMADIPFPMRSFFLSKFPSMRVWCNWDNIDDNSKSIWAIGPVAQVHPWVQG